MNRNVRFWLLLGGALVVVVLIVGGSGSSGPPYDPRSVAPDGARGVVEVLERLGADVDLGDAVPAAEATTALILQDRLTPDDDVLVQAWVRAGGVLVVADTNSSLAADRVGFSQPLTEQRPAVLRGQCTIGALSQVEELAIRGRLLEVGDGDSCFGDGNRAFVVTRALGDGTIVTVGSPDLFINSELDQGDAAVLATALLAPERGDSHVTFIGPSLVDFGDEEIGDIVPPRVWNAILQLLAAFLLYALYRSRRLGGVVPEPVPVRIEGSELVLKAGLLSERAKDPTSAATILRADVIHRARRALSVPAAADDAALADQIALRTGASPDYVMTTLTSPVVTDADLVEVARGLAALEHALYDETPTTADTMTGSAELVVATESETR